MKILLAADGSEFTKHMLAYLAAHDEFLGKQHQFSVLTVVPAVPAQASHFIDQETIKGYYAEQADAVLRPIAAFAAQHHWNVELKHMAGHAAEVIAKTATEGAFDMLVMGSHGHSALGSLVMGSVVSSVMARCKTPVLIIR